jgi:hypothetical protein
MNACSQNAWMDVQIMDVHFLFEVDLSHFSMLQHFFQKDSSKFFKNYLMSNLTQGYSSLETREPDL